MKRITILFILILFLFTSSYSIGEKPPISAQAAILIDRESGRVLLEYNPHIKLPMASTTKIMTALVALENGELEKSIEIDENAVGIEGSSIYLYEDETISLEDLLYGLMLRSGNDSAVAIANHIGGDLEGFANMMNNRAKELGANNSNFTNPHGLFDENHYTTAYDLGLITKTAMGMEKFREISQSKTWKAKRGKNNLFYNKNKTLWEYNGGDGVKTGYTIRSGRCLVTSATRNGMQLISVVLNDRNWFEDCYDLMDYGFEKYKSYVILDKGQYFGRVSVSDGNREYVNVISKDSFFYPLTEEELENIKIHVEIPNTINAPVEKNKVIGKINVFLDGKLIYKGDLISREDIYKPNTIEKFLNKIKS